MEDFSNIMPHPSTSLRNAQKMDKQAATALAALEKLRLEEEMELLEAQRAEEVGSLKVALEKLRIITYKQKFDWKETLLVQQTEENTDDRNVTDEQFVEALHIANEDASDKVTVGEFEILLRKFCDYKGDVRIAHFLRALNIGPPTDHADPELMFDELPQPYKLIVEVLEEDILDAAWDIIDQKYQLSAGNTALDEDNKDGEEIQKIAMAMSTPCFPLVNGKIGDTPTCVNHSKDGNLCLIGYVDGSVKLVENVGCQMIGTHSAFPDSHGGITSLSEIVDSENFKVSGGAPKLVAVGASQLTKEAFALAANGSGEEEEDKKSGKSKKDKKKGKDASDEEEGNGDFPGGFVHVYEIWESEPMFALVATLSVDREVDSVVLSPAARFLSVSLVDGSVQVYSIPNRPLPLEDVSPELSGIGQMEPVVEEQEMTEMGEEGKEGNNLPFRFSREKVSLERPALKIILTAEDRRGVLKPIKSVAEAKIIALLAAENSKHESLEEKSVEVEGGGKGGKKSRPSSKNSSRSSSKNEMTPSEDDNQTEDKSVDPCGIVTFIQTPVSVKKISRSEKFLTTGLFVWWPGSNHLKRYYLDGKVVNGAKEIDNEEGDEIKQKKNHKVLHSEWLFASAITATCIDVSCSIMVVGLADGSVIVWDVHTGRRRTQFRRHTGLVGNRAAVSALAVWGQRYVVSGAMDGSVQVNDMLNGDVETICRKIMSGVGKSSVARLNNLDPEFQLVSMREKDGSSTVLNLSCLSDIPIAVAVCEDKDGIVTLRLYDLPSGTFMGVLDPRRNGDVDVESCNWMFGKLVPDSFDENANVLDARPQGDASRSGRINMKKISGNGVSVKSGNKVLGPRQIFATAKGGSIFVICSDRKEAEIAKNFVPQPSKLEVNEENESENNIENESAPVVTYQMNIYQDWKLICDAYPAIATTCQNGTDVAQNAKRLFMITTAEQRSDPKADLEAFLLGPPGLHPKPYGNAVPTQSAGTNAALSIRSGKSSRTHISKTSNRSQIISRHAPPAPQSSSGFGDSQLSRGGLDRRASRQTRSKAYSGTAGENSTVSLKSRKGNVLISAAIGSLPLEANAENFNLLEPKVKDGENLLKLFLNMKNATRERRNRRVKKRSQELLKFCTPEL